MQLDDFKSYVRESRSDYILTPKNLVYDSFEELGFNSKDESYFYNEASFIIEQLREKTWGTYLEEEKTFTSEMFKSLINQDELDGYSKMDAIVMFIEKYGQHSYSLSLSNTQSRRSRAGNEFEYMIELILMGSNIPFDTQGSVGSGVFETAQLAKMVDCVSPGANEYKINKRNTSLISAKTTLRERWQEVGDEMSRTKASEMYLATLDDSLTDNTLSLIGTNNIIIVTTKKLKDERYSTNHNVISFETMLLELTNHLQFWENYDFSKEEISEKISRYENLIDANEDKEFVKKYYQNSIKYIQNKYS